MLKYYFKKDDNLICIYKKADSKFWDEHWNRYGITKIFQNIESKRHLIKYLEKYLADKQVRILEAGCGVGE